MRWCCNVALCRGSTHSVNMVVPKQTLKRQIKTLHPSCSSGMLKSLSNNGIRRVEAILGFFCQVSFAVSRPPLDSALPPRWNFPWPKEILFLVCSKPVDKNRGMQALVQQVAGIALAKGTRVISDSSLLDAGSGIENLKDPTLRKLLDLEDLALPVPDPPVDMDIEPENLMPASYPATGQGKGERVGSHLSDDELAQQLVGKVKEEAEADAGADDVQSKQVPNEANAASPGKPLATQAASSTVTQNPVHSPEPSDDEGNKTESVSSTHLLFPLLLPYSEISRTVSCSLAAALWLPCACFSRGTCQRSSYPCQRAS